MKKLKLFLLHPFLVIFCPDFWKSFPVEDKEGPWVACALRTNLFNREGTEIYTRLMPDATLKEAYVVARKLALKLDNRTPYADGELGINWAIRRPNENDRYYE